MPSVGAREDHRRAGSIGWGQAGICGGGGGMMRKYPIPSGPDDWGKLPEEQDKLVQQLRESLEARNAFDEEKHDYGMLLRFLRARDYDISRATRMMLDHLQWRQENRVDQILDEFNFTEREEFLSTYPQGYHKTDKQGHPVYIQHLGNINLTRIREVTTEERMLKYHIQEYERCLKHIFPVCSKVWNRQIDSTFAVMDVKGIGFYHMTKEVRNVLAMIMKVDSDNYPETLYHTCLINAPATFRAVWAVIKPMLNKRTQDKIEVCPKDYMPCLKKWIDEENIPEYLGGKSKGTLIDDVGPWHSEEPVREVEMERPGGQGAAEGDISARSARHDDWTPMRQSSTLSNATVFEDAIDREIDDLGVDDSIPAVGHGMDPPTMSEATVSTSGTPRRSTALAARIHDLESRLPTQVARLRSRMGREDRERLQYFSSAPRGSLLGRVEVLEEGMELLLAAQERSWGSRQARRSSCACCSIM
ncbi:unnamed protein product [Ostreobium quekettii]|uniref:CRAL-TRIO domain-containing protein n=1 Tax=Ostreobium quekettii TaxID=121088 RepID=A0A8S1J3H0_9CHLO|nr:unnamed protein product [Ostreobium quekettii]